MKILLIGTGYVGMALLSSWKEPNDTFTATTTTALKLDKILSQRKKTTPLLLKITPDSSLVNQLNNYDTLIVTIAPKNGDSYQETYLETSKIIKESLKERNKPLYLIYTSSTSVYGNQKGRTVDEKHKCNPSSQSGIILCKTEENYSSISNSNITTCILRLGGIYGYHRTLENRALKMSGKKLSGTGKEPTNHSHLEDITDAIEYCINHKLHGTYNLVNDEHPSRKNLYNKICEKLNISPPIWDISQNTSRSTNALVSNEKIKNAGFEFKQPSIMF